MFWRVTFTVFPLVVWAGLLFLFVRPLRLPRRGAWALAALLLVTSQKFVIYRLFGTSVFQPELPRVAVNALGWVYAATVILFGFSLVVAGVWGVRRLLGAKEGLFGRAPRRVGCVLALLALAVASWGMWEGIRVPRVHRVEIALNELPAGLDGLTIVHLSDLHASAATDRAHFEGIVRAVNALEADLVCITGDFADGSPQARGDQLAPLAQLRSRYGTFACTGNHEFYSSYRAWRPIFESYGIAMLDNACRVIRHNGAQLAVGGVVDGVAHRREPAAWPWPDVSAAFASAPPATYRLLLQHQPYVERNVDTARVGLQLSGHTHGGAILGMDLIVKATNYGHLRGLYREGPLALFVSPGTGQWAGFPMRLGVPSEITLLVLRAPRGESTR